MCQPLLPTQEAFLNKLIHNYKFKYYINKISCSATPYSPTSNAVPSAQAVFTSLFGMERGVFPTAIVTTLIFFLIHILIFLITHFSNVYTK